MKNLFILSHTFTGQRGPDDCGTACLAMMLNYTGRSNDANMLVSSQRPAPGGFSLLELRDIALSLGLRAKCVRMDIEHLRELDTPSVLHVITADGRHHFVVCYHSRSVHGKRQYLTGDPARGIGWMSEPELREMWSSGAALYMEGLTFRLPGIREHSWIKLIGSISGQRMLLISIPLINIAAAWLGVALSWLLQRGINDPLAERNRLMLVAIVVLLAIIMTGRNLASHLKQLMLVRINSDLRKKYHATLVGKLTALHDTGPDVRKLLTDIQKIQNSVVALLAVFCSESALILLLLCGLWYYEPVNGLINSVYIIIMLICGIRDAAVSSGELARLNELSFFQEKDLADISRSDLSGDRISAYQEREISYGNRARKLATFISRSTLLYDAAGSLSVITVLSYCLYLVRAGNISYTMLMTEVILSYFITMLMPRVCQVLPVISEGARLNRNFIN